MGLIVDPRRLQGGGWCKIKLLQVPTSGASIIGWWIRRKGKSAPLSATTVAKNETSRAHRRQGSSGASRRQRLSGMLGARASTLNVGRCQAIGSRASASFVWGTKESNHGRREQKPQPKGEEAADPGTSQSDQGRGRQEKQKDCLFGRFAYRGDIEHGFQVRDDSIPIRGLFGPREVAKLPGIILG